MKVDGDMISECQESHPWEAGDNSTLSLNESFSRTFNFCPVNPIPVNIEIHEDDNSAGGDDLGTTKANLTYDYEHDEWKWAYDSGNNWWKNEKGEKANDRKNSNITIGDGDEKTFTEEYRNADGDTDVTIRISWKE